MLLSVHVCIFYVCIYVMRRRENARSLTHIRGGPVCLSVSVPAPGRVCEGVVGVRSVFFLRLCVCVLFWAWWATNKCGWD